MIYPSSALYQQYKRFLPQKKIIIFAGFLHPLGPRDNFDSLFDEILTVALKSNYFSRNSKVVVFISDLTVGRLIYLLNICLVSIKILKHEGGTSSERLDPCGFLSPEKMMRVRCRFCCFIF